ncbi:MAG: hypothetical protein ISS45_07550 [Candidatus Omnitrophica bacterium]|nr:hypothetical protein [Candidatus Omnitrophota bacterium]
MNRKQEISFLLDKQEFELLKEIIIVNEDIDESIDRVKLEGNKCRLKFSYDALDELLGFLAAAENHAKSKNKQKRLENLYDKLKGLLNLSGSVKFYGKTKILSKRKAGTMSKVYVFDVWIDNPETPQRILRKIGISDTKSLYNFAKSIVEAFGFDFDHCFGFYDNLQNYNKTKVGYELFVDIGEEPLRKGFKGVKKTKISELFSVIGAKMLFLFDYGDEWHFIVELKEIREALASESLPALLESIGKAPVQYPPCE